MKSTFGGVFSRPRGKENSHVGTSHSPRGYSVIAGIEPLRLLSYSIVSGELLWD